LITGVAGFIGSHIAKECLERGYNVRGIDNLTNGRIENIEEFLHHKKFEFIKGDICDYSICLKVTTGIDYVMHEAAWGSIPKSIEEPLQYTKNNILGMHNMLQASFVNKIKTFVYASSASVYGDDKNKIKKVGQEGDLLSPYALSKKTDEDLAKLYYFVYGLNTVGLRYFNVFGPKQDSHSVYAAVIPKFVKAILEQNSITIYGNGIQSRDFTYVSNVVDANIKACFSRKMAWGKVFNVACGRSTSIKELYNHISAILNKKTKIKYEESRRGDIKNSLADIERTEEVLGYKPRVMLKEGLEKTVSWYKEKLCKDEL
ncbi:MAG: GDP-mannose 4,6-dehydratase, partial [Anaeroplasmataceae bacterium]|nr:GDP-mannose 4,6-dehydratase [Anaeroplasmataceae bacterium]